MIQRSLTNEMKNSFLIWLSLNLLKDDIHFMSFLGVPSPRSISQRISTSAVVTLHLICMIYYKTDVIFSAFNSSCIVTTRVKFSLLSRFSTIQSFRLKVKKSNLKAVIILVLKVCFRNNLLCPVQARRLFISGSFLKRRDTVLEDEPAVNPSVASVSSWGKLSNYPGVSH